MRFDVAWSLSPAFTFTEIEELNTGFDITASTSADVVAYRVTLALSGTEVGSKEYIDDAAIAHPTEPEKRRFELADDPDWPNLDGSYDVSVFAIDDAGNLSVPLSGNLTLDFVPPDSPTGFEPF